jgi:hypothetical protein
MLESELYRNISGVLFPRLANGVGLEFRYQDGDVVLVYHAREAEIAKITQPRTKASLETNQAPRTQVQAHVRKE